MKENNPPLHSAGGSTSLINAIKLPAIWVPIVIAFLLLLAITNNGLMRDDFLHRALLLGEETIPGYVQDPYSLQEAVSGLFSFSTEGGVLLEKAKAYGNVPWWTSDELKVNFWRPVAAFTHWLDYQLWPNNAFVMHLHSLLWYVLVAVLLGYWLLNLGVSKTALWLTMFVYVLDASHIHAIGWLANRNILIATAFGILSLIFLNFWSKHRASKYLIVALALYLVTLFSAEAGISVFGLVLPFILLLDKGSLKAKLTVISLYILVTVGWRILYSSLGYGAAQSGFYLDPINNMNSFVASLFTNGPIMLYEQLIRVPTLSMLMAPGVEMNQVVISFVVLTLALLLFLPLLKRNRLALFGLASAVIAVPPACATLVTGGRLMFFFGIGVSLLVGLWFDEVRKKPDWLSGKKIYKGFAYMWSIALALSILGGSGFVWYAKVSGVFGPDKPPFNVYTNVLDHVGENQTLVLINPPVVFEQMYLPLKGNYYGNQVPKNIVILAPGYTGFTLEQSSDRRITVTNDKGFLISPKADWYEKSSSRIGFPYLFRRVDSFFTVQNSKDQYLGQTKVGDAQIEVSQITEMGDPTKISATFSKPLTSGDYVFLVWRWKDSKYSRIEPDSFAGNELYQLEVAGPFTKD